MNSRRTRETTLDGERGPLGHHARIYRVVRAIPHGRVATYGQVAAIAGRCTPRMVGYAMASVPPGADVPWHRVINSHGGVSLKADGYEMQTALLRSEGVEFDARGRVELSEYGWTGPGITLDGENEDPADGFKEP